MVERSPGPGATSAQIKGDINGGLTGDKVPGFDPAAAPLGVDEEAGGAPYDPHLLARTRDAERAGRPRNSNSNAASPELQPDARAPSRKGSLLLGALAGLVAAAALAAVILLL
jgi:hypothetical protein